MFDLMVDPNSFVDVSKLFEFLEIPEVAHGRALDLLRIRMADTITCLPRALNGWTSVDLVDTEHAPPSYGAISDMSPDRRHFYLPDKRKAERSVYVLGKSTVSSISSDPSYALDRCCHHWSQPYPMHVFYSSELVDSVKKSAEFVPADLERLAILATAAITESGVRVTDNILRNLPRSRNFRSHINYEWLPIGPQGSPLFVAASYPNKGKTPEGALHTLEWYVWFSILGQDPRTRLARFTTARFGKQESYFVYKNPYHLVVQKLRFG